MPEVTRVETAEYSPGVCVFCRSHEGPFVKIDTPLVDVAITAVEGLSDFPAGEARTTVQGAFYVCVGRDDADNGCARQIGMAADCLNPQEAAGLVAHVTAHRTKVLELEQQVAQLEAEPKVIPVDELLALIRQEASPPTVSPTQESTPVAP